MTKGSSSRSRPSCGLSRETALIVGPKEHAGREGTSRWSLLYQDAQFVLRGGCDGNDFEATMTMRTPRLRTVSSGVCGLVHLHDYLGHSGASSSVEVITSGHMIDRETLRANDNMKADGPDTYPTICRDATGRGSSGCPNAQITAAALEGQRRDRAGRGRGSALQYEDNLSRVP